MQIKRIFILFVAMLWTLSGNCQENSPQRTITVNYKDQRLGDVLEDLGKNHAVRLTYSSGQLNLDKRVNISLEKQPVEKVLNELCRQADLEYRILRGQVILKPLEKPEPAGESGSSQPFQTIKGIVRDKVSGIPLPGVAVLLRSLSPARGVNTDENGNFRLDNIPVGRHIVEFSFIGYGTVTLSEVLLTSGKETQLSVELPERISSLGMVTVTGSGDRRQPLNEMANVSARAFSMEETSRYAASIFDPARMALNFAGVTSNDDGSNNIIIRGNSPKSLQWRLEGVEITNPNHFGEEGGSGGGVSMISSSMLSASDFLTGAFPAEYGNALSGVFDLRFRKGNTEKREYAFMAGALGTEASLEGPFNNGGRASYLVNYRYSTFSILDKAGIAPFGDDIVPNYQDLAFNLNFPTAAAGTFSLFGIGGISSQNHEASRNIAEWEEHDDKFNRSFRYYSGSTGVKHLWLLSDKIYLKNIISWSGSRITDDADTLDNQFETGIYARDAYVNTALRYSGMINYKVNARNTVRSGAIVSNLGFNLNSRTYKKDIDRLSDFLNARGEAWNHEIYVQWKHELSERISLNAGVHLNYFNLSDSWSTEPRIGFSWWVSPDQRLSLGTGIHSRLEPLAFYFALNERPDGTVIRSNSALSPTKAFHLVLGYEKIFRNNLKFKTEAYYQHLYKVPVSNDPAFNFSTLNVGDAYFIYSRNYRSLVNKGTGRNNGLELSLERSLSDGYYFLLTTSLFDSRFRALGGRTFNTAFNSNYTGNLVAGKEWETGPSDKNLLGLNAKIMGHGGMPYSPVDLERSRQLDDHVVDENRVNELRTAPYFRIDLSLTYRINRPGLTHAFFIDIQNVLNRYNEYGKFYDVDKNAIETVEQGGLVPSVYYRIEF